MTRVGYTDRVLMSMPVEDLFELTLSLLEPTNDTRKMVITPGLNELLRSVVSGVAERCETLLDIIQGERDSAKHCYTVLPIVVSLQIQHLGHLPATATLAAFDFLFKGGASNDRVVS